MRLPWKITWADGLLAVAVLLTAGGLFLVFSVGKPSSQAVVTTPNGNRVLSLTEDTATVFTGQNGHTVTVEVKNGTLQVTKATCPDKLCVHSGKLSRAGQTAACVPAGIVIRIAGETEVDAVAR